MPLAPRSQCRLPNLIGLLSCIPAVWVHADDRPPNVLLIMSDDQGWGDVRAHGNELIDTPNQDRLAREGASFERFFVSPVCAPTRSSLLTGRYHPRTGVHGVTRGMENMRAEEVTVAEAFRAGGYATGCFGKWHNGKHFPLHPNGQGFDEFFGFCAGHWNNYFDSMLEHNGEQFHSSGFITDVLTDYALDFIDANADQPFLCYVPYNAPHSPWQVPDSYWEKYGGRGLSDEVRCCYAMVENIDDNIGRLLNRLAERNLDEQTIVLFLTDNGPNTDRYNGGMRGRKGSVHEGGVRVPLFVRWPGMIEPGREIPQIAAHVDLFATLVDLCGIAMPQTLPQDGRSLAPLLLAKDVEWPDRTLLTFRTGRGNLADLRGAARNQRFRAVLDRPGRGWELYDMQADPQQQRDVAEEHPDVLAKLQAEFEHAVAEMDLASLSPLPVPIGFEERPLVELPGHEAFLHPAQGSGISYHGPNGWANDWIDNWTDAAAFPYWNVDIERSGHYDVSILYSCPQADVGSTIRVQIGDAAVEGRVTQAHDPPPLRVHDRVGRKEAPDKIWQELILGACDLAAGPARLEVRAVEKTGSEVMDLKAVRVRRVD